MEKQQPDTFEDEQFARFVVMTFIAVWIFSVVAVVFYFWWFRHLPISSNPSDWGPFGDYLGGVINPAVGLATVLLVVISITIQRKELRASLREMRSANDAAQKSSFEQSLFAWLENYHAQVALIEIDEARGRKALHRVYDTLLSPVAAIGMQLPADADANEILLRLDVPGQDGMRQLGERLLRAVIRYQGAYAQLRADLDAPFRTLYRLIRWIDKSDRPAEEKWHYCALVRSQLSWSELVVIYYNCLTIQGEKLAVYANKYALFDNLVGPGDHLIRFAIDRVTPLPSTDHPKLRDGSAPWPFTPSAFHSITAKQQLNIAINI